MSILPLNQGGTGSDLSGTGGANEFLKQTSVGANVSVAAISTADISAVGVVQNPTAAQTITGKSLTLTGTAPLTVAGNLSATAGQNAISAYSINNVIQIDGNKYPCTAAGFNNAIGALPLTGGIVDARGCTAAITTQTTTVSVGSNSQYGVTLLLPATTYSGSANPLFFVNLRSVLVTEPATLIEQTNPANNGVIIAGNNGSFSLSGGIEGRGAIVGPGSGTGVGLILGGTPDNLNSVSNSGNFLNIGPISIRNFGLGIEIGNFVWSVKFDHTMVYGNTNPLSQPAMQNNVPALGSAENINFDHVQFAAGNTVGTLALNGGAGATNGGAEFSFDNCSFDGNVVSINNSVQVRVDFKNPHFEMIGALGVVTTPFITTVGGGPHIVQIFGGLFLEDKSSGRTTFISHGSGTLRVYGTAFEPAETILGSSVVNVSGTATTELYGITTSNISALIAGTGTGPRLILATDVAGVGDVELNLQQPLGGSGSKVVSNSFYTGPGNLLISSTAPTISSGFGTGPTIPNNNGPASFVIVVGTTPGSTGVIGLPAASNFWNCFATNQSRGALIAMTAGTSTSVTLTNYGSTFTATNFVAGDILDVSCFAR